MAKKATQGLAVGDVVYLLDSKGEGAFNIWRRGGVMENDITDFAIEWDKPPDVRYARRGAAAP